ncbi:hypothetical protein CLV68_2530 [Actinokineospora cianjurensis]|uniref:Uncharacterized protein n=1 Tax=Actinokineospora cianjurensis TaxID=585224 RepID=A0A421BCD9_9PSEU|nr:hypothetical protein CLV68_2530 [Actinokineospora cianjurensis]
MMTRATPPLPSGDWILSRLCDAFPITATRRVVRR